VLFCNKCGQGLAEGTTVCPNCGNVLSLNNGGSNSAARLKSTFSGSNYTPSPTPASAPVDVNKTYCMPVEFDVSSASAPAPKSAPSPGYTLGNPYSAPAAPASSYSGGYGYSEPTHSYVSRSYDAASSREHVPEKKGVGGRITRTILVSILFLIVLFGPMYGGSRGLFPENYYNLFERYEHLDDMFEAIEYYTEYDNGLMVFSYITYLASLIILTVATVGSFISGLCNGKGAVRAFSVLGIVAIALFFTALCMEVTAVSEFGESGFGDIFSRALDPERGVIHIGLYTSFVIFIVNCAIASKD